MAIEFEMKFRATPLQLQQLRAAFPGYEQTTVMRTVYYDTPTGQLSARHYTLRCRRENDSHICTAKAPTQGRGRGEWEVACDSIEAAVSVLCKLGAPQELLVLVKEGLIPICGAEFTRVSKDICQDGFTAELALDQGILTGGGRTMPLCEVELELKSGDERELESYACMMAALYGLAPEEKSKFRRALELYRGE